VSDFFAGMGFFFRGLGMYARSPRLMLLGLIPAALTGLLLVGALVLLVFFVDDLTAFVTPFADNWAGGVRDTARLLIGIAMVGAWILFSVLLFAELTLLVGQPFYEAISKSVDDKLGGVPGEINVSFWKTLPRTIVDNVRLVLITAVLAAASFVVGVVPVVGEAAAPVLAAMVGGWALALELSSVPFERRGLRFRDRRKMLSDRRAMALGFGIPTFLCFLFPPLAVLTMPAAVAGATLLSRRLFGQPGA
jgi:CysZ protein